MNLLEIDSILEHRPLLHCEPKYDAIVCLKCNNNFSSKRIALHFIESPKKCMT